LASEVDRLEAQILAWHRADDTSRRLATISGIGPITASAIAAAVPDASLFRSGRQFAAWLGLTPRPHSSGGKERLGGISKQGDGYLRKLLVVGATAVMRMARKDAARQPWVAQLLGAQAGEDRDRWARQQDSVHRLGGDGAQGSLRGGCRVTAVLVAR
jgi:transposase